MSAYLSKDTLERLVNSTSRSPSPRVKRMQLVEAEKERLNWSKNLGQRNLLSELRCDINGVPMTDLDTISEVSAFPAFTGDRKGTMLKKSDPYISEKWDERLPSHRELRKLRKKKGFGPSPKEVERFPEPKFDRQSAALTPVKSIVAIVLDRSGRL